ncbi:hypothetical protein [Vibrio cholerae]|uniref:hypothetical protein n=1 Tax=Vibrio cholerae TaxID=666 RepID=UPI0018F06608|nr:hypothetical protein [Vibrio cholerae]EGQ7759997.1 hypothetical protein [Vibrio vulnificus]EGR4362692.1 hypothetical protein [Vibrio cholerae]EJB5285424.1 hypothetical protein [Vibrio vulnificus]EKD9069048.1 hypothetical protein [Vibrio vulnificus]MBJ6953945.1 hypothetical protein [Vibrio cholerae]
MNKNVARVINGIIKLTSDEKKEFLKQLGELEKYPTLTKKEVEESLQKSVVANESYSVSLGPTPTGCPCCGK